MNRVLLCVAVVFFGVLCCGVDGNGGCPTRSPTAASGVQQARATVKTGADGLTVEQRNVKKRYDLENVPGSIKHLYVISAYSGQVLIYSTVQGKVTSSGKRLSPYSVVDNGTCMAESGFDVDISGMHKRTAEVLQDDGTYGGSIEYLYWFDSQDRFHQHYLAGGQIVHLSDQPLAVKSVILNMEAVHEN